MDSSGERAGRAPVGDTKATLVRVIATLVLGPLLLLDLYVVGPSPTAPHGCGGARCYDALTASPALAALLWLVAVVALLIALCLPGQAVFRTARFLVLLASTTCGLLALLIPSVLLTR